MGKHKYYSGAKGAFVQNRMNEGRTNKQAHKDWKKSTECIEYKEKQSIDNKIDFDPIDRNYNSIMQDWAPTAEDH